jgi:hypothetical protein
MASEDSSYRLTKTTTEKSEQPYLENGLVGHSAEDPEQNLVQENPESKPEETSPDEFLGWSRLLFILVGLWFAVFLYSLVSLWPRS